MLSVAHSYAGLNLYLLMARSKDKTVLIQPLYTGYAKYTVAAIDLNTIKITQADTGGISKVGILRIS